ncbi:hypothetical protein K458DRAFT_120188 [Lentithecium fluviatile CBS 122367]|uniref:Uncharacterized protein n=1 Tax=Lentithecium fluviatile CBS 122367 TaxID=1168545 RepID=A0A6G1ILI3_9PLEO|nr:hypothetical protein K458DRAFT_120188 [Lentithecium fluviatile CBS 122367]
MSRISGRSTSNQLHGATRSCSAFAISKVPLAHPLSPTMATITASARCTAEPRTGVQFSSPSINAVRPPMRPQPRPSDRLVHAPSQLLRCLYVNRRHPPDLFISAIGYSRVRGTLQPELGLDHRDGYLVYTEDRSPFRVSSILRADSERQAGDPEKSN